MTSSDHRPALSRLAPGPLPAFALVLALTGAFPACARQPPAAASAHSPGPSSNHDRLTVAADAGFAELIDSLSEPGGYFDTDNLISNESSYGQAVELLEPTGGVYVGVGPEQNFSYIAQLRPSWAFVVDVRRDNQLHLLLLAAILRRAPDALGYLCLQFSRAPCGLLADDAPWALDDVVRRFEAAPRSPETFESTLRALLDDITSGLGVALDDDDAATLRAIHRAFFDDQLELRFETHGRRFQTHHPTDRQLILARTPSGEPASFLASRERYESVRSLALAGRLVPVVGDFGGDRAFRAIAEFVEARDEQVTTIYTSNVEYYLIGTSAFDRWVANVEALPLAADAVTIRACFHYGRRHPASVPGHRSTLLVQPVAELLEWAKADGYRSYWDLCLTPWRTAPRRP